MRDFDAYSVGWAAHQNGVELATAWAAAQALIGDDVDLWAQWENGWVDGDTGERYGSSTAQPNPEAESDSRRGERE